MSKITNCICKTCQTKFESNRAHKQYCTKSCYRKDPLIKAKYAKRTKIFLKKHNLTDIRKYSQLISKCKFKKYDLDISKEEYSKLLLLGCDYCGTELIGTHGVSLDRKDSNKGYLKDNVVPCCGKCNQIKNIHLTYEEMKAAMKAVLEIRNNDK
jgi:hypothetical protein